MSNWKIIIPVEAAHLASIEDAARDAMKLANRLEFPVQFKYMNATCIAYPGGDYLEIVKSFNGGGAYGYGLHTSYPRVSPNYYQQQGDRRGET